MALAPVEHRETGRQTRTTNGCQKAGPVITDQGGYWCKIWHYWWSRWPRKTLNNIPGVLENGIFVGVTDLVLVGEVQIISPLWKFEKRLATKITAHMSISCQSSRFRMLRSNVLIDTLQFYAQTDFCRYSLQSTWDDLPFLSFHPVKLVDWWMTAPMLNVAGHLFFCIVFKGAFELFG